jgi:hypothetical protein
MLLLVAFGALGLAGLTGSTVYRLASASRRVRREDRWQRPAPAARRRRASAAPPPPPIEEAIEDVHEDEFEPQHLAHEPHAQDRYEPPVQPPRSEARAGDINHRREQIEAYLAQLTRQLQADLEATARVD